MKQVCPGLDEFCGRYFSYRDFIECGETQTRTQIANIPIQPASYTALAQLARSVLDPLIDYFGMIRLTYGFCSRELVKAIPGRIAPRLDQHAAYELNSRRQPVCPRLGAAVDFIVDDESMLEVAQWIVANTAFDRLYFYGDARPLHVSIGPEHSREIVLMRAASGGRLVPRVMGRENFLRLTDYES
jgi:hypothetical protein